MIVGLFLFGCGQKISKVENPKEKTTVQLQEISKDTMLVYINNGKLYLFDLKTKNIQYQLTNYEWSIGILIILGVGLFVGLVVGIISDE